MLELRRNVAHLLLGTFFALLVVSLSHALVIICNAVLIGGLVVASFLYQRYNIVFLTWLFRRFDRPSSRFTAKGAITFFVGTFIAVLLFAPLYAALSILVLSISDSLATIAGHYAGKHVLFQKKTFEGTLTFFVCAFAILVFFVAPTKAALVALIAAATELITPPNLDDNITIPFITGLLLSL
jgi:dolichol kinase